MSHLRDRRAFGNIGTRKFRGARFGDALSPRVDPAVSAFAAESGATDLTGLNNLVVYLKEQSKYNNFVIYPMKSAQNAGSGSTVYSLGGLTNNNIALVNSPSWGANDINFEGATTYATLDAPFFESIGNNGYLGLRFKPRVASAPNANDFDYHWSFGNVSDNSVMGTTDSTGVLNGETFTTVNPLSVGRTGSTTASWTAGEDIQEICQFGTFGSDAFVYKAKVAYTMNLSSNSQDFRPSSSSFTDDNLIIFSGRRNNSIGANETGKYTAAWICNASLTTLQRETITDLVDAL